MSLHGLEGHVLLSSYSGNLFLFCLVLRLGKIVSLPFVQECLLEKQRKNIFSFPPSVFVLPVLCYCIILPTAGYLGNVDIYSLSLQRYKIRYCKDLAFLILSNTDL